MSEAPGKRKETYTVKLGVKPTGNVKITPISSNRSNAIVRPSSLTFTPTNWSTPQTVTVKAVDDDFIDPTRTATITHKIRGGGFDSTTPTPTVSVTVTNDDASDFPSVITFANYSPTSQRRLTVHEGGLSLYRIRLSRGPLSDVTVTVSSADTSVATAEPTRSVSALTFTRANWKTIQEVVVYGVDNTVVDPEVAGWSGYNHGRTTHLTHSVSGGGYGDVTVPTSPVFVRDDDGRTFRPRAPQDTARVPRNVALSSSGQITWDLDADTAGDDRVSYWVEWEAKTKPPKRIGRYSDYATIKEPECSASTGCAIQIDDFDSGLHYLIHVNTLARDVADLPPVVLRYGPGPPGQLAAPAVSAPAGSTTSLDVRWRAPANTSPAIESYDLRYRAGSSGNWIDGPQDVTTTSTALTGLEAGTSYQVQVRGTNARGDGSWSDTGSGTTSSPTNTAPTFDETSYTFDLAETADGRTTPVPIGRVTATDADTGDVVTYSLTAGNPGNRFMIHASTGALRYVGSGEHHEGFPDPATAFVLTVQASDGTAHSSVPVTVRVTAVAESARPGAPSDAPPELGAPDAVVLTFGEAIIANQHYVPHAAIPLLTLPAATGGAGPFTYDLSPALPAGLTFDPATRQISGTPTAPQGATIYTYRVRDRDGETVELTFTLAVALPVASLTAGAASVPEGGVAPFTVTLSGPAPAGGLTVRVLVREAAGGAFVAAPHEGPQTLTIPAGATAQRYEVPTVANEMEEAAGRITVELQPGPGYTVSAQAARAAVTVTDDDRIGIERGWLARVGRTVGTHVTDALSTRLRPGADAAAHVTVGGTRLALGAGRPGAAAAASRGAGFLASVAGLLGLSPGGTPDAPFGEATPVPRPGQGQALDVDLRHLLVGSAFRLHLGAAEAGAARLTAWGRVAGTRFSGRDGARALEGDLLTGTVGVDRAWGRWLAGVAVSHTWGDGGLQATSGPVALEQTLTSLHPYLRYAVTDRLDVWGVLGYGWGDVTRTPDAGAAKATDTTVLMGALGSRGVLRTAAEPGGVDLALRTDLMLTRTTADAVTGAQGWLAAAEGAAHRLRLVLEGARGVTWAEGRQLTPTLQVGLRHDWGDAETGFGLEVGGRVQYADPTLGLTVEGAVRGLVAHADSAYEEWGASGSVRFAPGAWGQGLAVTVAPAWGTTASGVESLWTGATPLAGGAAGPQRSPGGRVTAEVGYGVAAFARGLLTPYAGTSLAAGADRTYRVGTRWQAAGVTLNLEGARQVAAGTQPVNQGLRVQASWGF